MKQRHSTPLTLPLAAVAVGVAAGLVLASAVITRRWGRQSLWFLRGA